MNPEPLSQLGALYLLEPDDETLAHLRDDPRFAHAASASAEDLRVEFTRLFAMSVFPYASVFLDAEGLMNTETAARVETEYARAGFHIDPRYPIGAPDHFGAELLFAAYLLENGNNDATQSFLQAEVLPWTGIFTHAVERAARQDFYRVLARESRKWLFENTDPGCTDFPTGDVLIDNNALDEILMMLLTPAQSGIYLNKDDLRRIANRLDVPISFGDRWVMLRSLFRAAGEYGRIVELVQLLIADADAWMACFSDDSQTYPSNANVSREWLSRAERTRARLREMEQVAWNDDSNE